MVGIATQGISARITAIQIIARGTFGNARIAVIIVNTTLGIPSRRAKGTVRTADASWNARNASAGTKAPITESHPQQNLH